jgi:hypothetical protein
LDSRERDAGSVGANHAGVAVVRVVGADRSNCAPRAGDASAPASPAAPRTRSISGALWLGSAPRAALGRAARTAGCPTCRRRTDNSWRSTRISNSFDRSRRPRSTTNSSKRQATRYTADTSKGDLQRTGTPTLRRLSGPRASSDRVSAPHGPRPSTNSRRWRSHVEPAAHAASTALVGLRSGLTRTIQCRSVAPIHPHPRRGTPARARARSESHRAAGATRGGRGRRPPPPAAALPTTGAFTESSESAVSSR